MTVLAYIYTYDLTTVLVKDNVLLNIVQYFSIVFRSILNI